ncbi:MAG: hypothetical protein K0B07_05725 [DPANN group archaeon]|nr:hypothetical protein [DPANN group archaeon]
MAENNKILILEAEDPELSLKAKELKAKGWQFKDKSNGKIYYEQYQNPLMRIDNTQLILFLFVSFFISILILGLVIS